MESLTGKHALVTGAGKGIGRAIALALAQEGVRVSLLARTENDLQQVAAEIKALGGSSFTVMANVADITSVNAAVTSVLTQGPIDILINNAGIAAFGSFLALEPAQWEDIVKVNLFGVYYVTRAVLPAMIARSTGDIINISSTAGQRGAAVTSAYSASKAGLIALSESLMQEVRKHNIRVTSLTPSTVATDLAVNLQLTDGNPDKVMQPSDLAELVVMQLKLNRRVFVKEAGLWSTNP
ncbi:3-oxoacyl-[acyl-carrier protein] reductase [Chitinophaga costaii]|uniref:3-oxoacyl-[acyl-carrier protein] reductase n=1 Tax=Chitinophaga costaii TaxID=1335309 RepID=A0A1C3YYP7_9BACT|nr:3-ketoacyl-ACP reductase [Chitinophaga costaii]PUZ30157.1 3-ketoacyl-ACP reductase [Chitinophaga costaii]SCB75180.1 3-oxoacyl-[acyl-carrier protein] reductase [Chitinophaga costaii]